MSIWLFRAGKNGEYEKKFLNDNRVYLTWDDLDIDLKQFNEKEKLYNVLMEKYGLEKEKTAINWASQMYPIVNTMVKGDWVVLPSKINKTIHFGEIIGEYKFDNSLGSPYYHYRDVNWFALDIPRDKFEQDILYSFGAFMTVCKIWRNNAEERIKTMANNNWKVKERTLLQQFNGLDKDIILDLEKDVLDNTLEYKNTDYKEVLNNGYNPQIEQVSIKRFKGLKGGCRTK